jgi:hypothetical protein
VGTVGVAPHHPSWSGRLLLKEVGASSDRRHHGVVSGGVRSQPQPQDQKMGRRYAFFFGLVCLSVARTPTSSSHSSVTAHSHPCPLHCLLCALGIVCELQHALLPVSRTCFHGGGEPAPSGPAPVAFAINAHTQSCAISLSLIHSLTHSH